MRKYVLSALLAGICLLQHQPARAESEAACAIWLCLPGGFPTGCSAAYNEFKHRLKKRKPPLPSLSSCTTGPDGNSSNGSYDMGVEYYYPCKAGFTYNRKPEFQFDNIMCVPTDPRCELSDSYKSQNPSECTRYAAEARKKISFLRIWVDGKYLGQYFY
jgi:hypothetical protein